MSIQFIEENEAAVNIRNPRSMTEKLMNVYPKLAPTKKTANIVLFCIALFFFVLSIAIVVFTIVSSPTKTPPPELL